MPCFELSQNTKVIGIKIKDKLTILLIYHHCDINGKRVEQAL